MGPLTMSSEWKYIPLRQAAGFAGAALLTVEVRGVEIARERLVSPGTFRSVIPKAVLMAAA